MSLTFSEYLAFFCTVFIGTRSLVISAGAVTAQVGHPSNGAHTCSGQGVGV